VIVGGRYGSVDNEGISYTEREYDYAVETSKPVLGFLHSDPGEIPQKHTDKDPSRQKKFGRIQSEGRAADVQDVDVSGGTWLSGLT
jgi:hypothetical protein